MTPKDEIEPIDSEHSPSHMESDSIVPFDDVRKVVKLYAGLPIYTTARTGVFMQGETWLEDISGTRKVCAYISGTKYCATLT